MDTKIFITVENKKIALIGDVDTVSRIFNELNKKVKKDITAICSIFKSGDVEVDTSTLEGMALAGKLAAQEAKRFASLEKELLQKYAETKSGYKKGDVYTDTSGKQYIITGVKLTKYGRCNVYGVDYNKKLSISAHTSLGRKLFDVI